MKSQNLAHQKVQDFFQKLNNVDTLDDFIDSVGEVRNVISVEHSVYHAINSNGEPFALSTYDQGWEAQYEAEKLDQIDPVVRNAFTAFSSYNWKDLDWSDPKARELQRDAIDFGVGNQGLSTPMRGPNGDFALFSISHSGNDESWGRFRNDKTPYVLNIAYYLHETGRRLAGLSLDATSAGALLSPRERDVLLYLALGYSRARVSDQLGISEHTVRVYLDSARMKLNAQNAIHAIVLAMKSGQITP